MHGFACHLFEEPNVGWMIFFYNTINKKKEQFVPIRDKKVYLYTCGPTVYNYAHIGNARPAVVSQLLVRLFQKVQHYLMHILLGISR